MDLVKKQIDKWYIRCRQYFFKYKNGFYELPMLVNSPAVMVQGFVKMSFAKYDKKRNLVSSNNPFMKSELIHMEFGEELALFLSGSEFKKNLKFKFLYDKSIPCKHYFLRYQLTSTEKAKRSALSNGISYSTKTWLFYKPGCSPDNYYFKNTSGTFFTIYFTESWLLQFLENCDASQKNGLAYFLNSSHEFMVYPDDRENNSYDLFQKTIINKPEIADLDLNEFRNITYQVICDFLICITEGAVNEGFFQLTNNDRLKILEAEKYLRRYFTTNFPGIEHLAAKVGIAQTTLKHGFRLIYGKPVYKYYQAGKMQLAAERLIKNPELKISQLAHEMGYENPSKFSAAFKECTGFSPSEYIKIK
jgi:AraC-like DNA-binding protein